MTDYTKTTDFAVKDGLTSGDPNKKVQGSELETEFDNIATAVATKANKITSIVEDNILVQSSTGDLKDGGSTITEIQDGARPVGEITMYGASAAPSGWLRCDGSAVSRTTFADLFAVISTTFGIGDGSTTFNLPDLRGRFPIGYGTGDASDATAHSFASEGGTETHTLAEAELPAHTHGLWSTDGSSTGTEGGDGLEYSVAVEYITGLQSSILGGTGQYSQTSGTSDTDWVESVGSGTAHNNMPPYLAINYIIKT